MKRTSTKIIISIVFVLITSIILASSVIAISNPDDWNPNPRIESGNQFLAKAGIVLGWIQFLGILTAVIALTVIGIKYIFTSVEGKAEYKKAMLPYILGCFMLVGVSVLIGIIEYIATPTETRTPTAPSRPEIVDRVDLPQ